MIEQLLHSELTVRMFERTAELAVGEKARYAREGNAVYVIAKDGKERKLKLLLVEPRPSDGQLR